MIEATASSGLGTRILSALVLAPLTIVIIYFGGFPFILFAGATFGISIREWHGLVSHGEKPVLHMMAGLLYMSCCFLSFVLLRLWFPQGAWLTLCLLIAVWASDTGAYLTGKTLGGPKLAPKTSPKKTWAGLAGAMIFCGLSLVFLMVIAPHVSLIDTDTGLQRKQMVAVFIAGTVLGAIGQAGDLLISGFKRRAGLKDTGCLIPGHGGLLDRIDALLLVTPAFLTLAWFWVR